MSSYGHGCHLANHFCLDLDEYEIVLPLVAPPWCCLIVLAGCHIASCRPLIALPSRHLVTPAVVISPHPLIALPSCCLVTPAGCCIASCRPLIVPPSRQLVAPAYCHISSLGPLIVPRVALSSSRRTGWLLRLLSMRYPLVILLSRCATSCCLVAPAGCCAIISRRPLVAPLSCPLIVLAGCCIACPCATLAVECCLPPSVGCANEM